MTLLRLGSCTGDFAKNLRSYIPQSYKKHVIYLYSILPEIRDLYNSFSSNLWFLLQVCEKIVIFPAFASGNIVFGTVQFLHATDRDLPSHVVEKCSRSCPEVPKKYSNSAERSGLYSSALRVFLKISWKVSNPLRIDSHRSIECTQ